MVHSKNDNDSGNSSNSMNEMSLYSLIGRVHRGEDLSHRSASGEPVPASLSLYPSQEQHLHSVSSLQDFIQLALEITSDTTSHSRNTTRSNAPRRGHHGTRDGDSADSADSDSTHHGPPKSSKQ
jgi:hypothetical protein